MSNTSDIAVLSNKYERALLEIGKMYDDNTKLQEEVNGLNWELVQVKSKLAAHANGNNNMNNNSNSNTNTNTYTYSLTSSPLSAHTQANPIKPSTPTNMTQ